MNLLFIFENHDSKLSNNFLHESLFIYIVDIFYLYFMLFFKLLNILASHKKISLKSEDVEFNHI